MPKWAHHRNIANIINIRLSSKEMKEIDSKLDGVRAGYDHDFWRYDVASLRECTQEISNKYGVDGLKYLLLHMFLDTLQAFVVSERTKETLSARVIRACMPRTCYTHYTCETAFRYAVSIVKSYVESNLQKSSSILKQFLNDIEGKEREIALIVGGLPEVEGQVRRIEKFKERRERAGEVARRYGAVGFEIPLYTSFMLELWNTKKRGVLTKEEWGKRVLEKYKEQLKGFQEARREKIFRDFANIAKLFGYMN